MGPIAIYHRTAVAGNPNDADLKIERCLDYCRTRWGSEGLIFDDSGLSGLFVRRTALDALMKKVQAGEIKIIVLYQCTALGRGLLNTASLLSAMRCNGVEVHTVIPSGLADVAHSVCLFENDLQRSNQKAGREEAKARKEAQ